MAENEQINEGSLAAQPPQQLSIRASLVSRGLQEISGNANIENMYAWLDHLPGGSTLISISFQNGSQLPEEGRDMALWSKRLSEMTEQETRQAFYEEECTGLLSSHAFTEDLERNTYAWRGYIEIEGTHPFERSVNLVGASEKEMFLSAVGILLRRSLVRYSSIRLYCGGDTLLEFLSANLKDVQAFIEEANSELRATVVNIRKPDGTITKRLSGLSLVLTEHHRTPGFGLGDEADQFLEKGIAFKRAGLIDEAISAYDRHLKLLQTL
jgi:hypothetical protein